MEYEFPTDDIEENKINIIIPDCYKLNKTLLWLEVKIPNQSETEYKILSVDIFSKLFQSNNIYYTIRDIFTVLLSHISNNNYESSLNDIISVYLV